MFPPQLCAAQLLSPCRKQVGGIRRIIVPVELGYPDNDFNKAGPKPSTFSGGRTAIGWTAGWGRGSAEEQAQSGGAAQ